MGKARAARRHPDRFQDRDVFIGYIRPDEVAGQFCDNIADLILWDGGPQGRGRIRYRMSYVSGPRIAEARNGVVQTFLDRPDAQWILMLDTDMTFRVDFLYDMLDRCAEQPEIKVLGALCFAGGRTAFPKPVIYGEPEPGRFKLLDSYPIDAVAKVAATGAACMLVHRSVMEDVRAKYQGRAHIWFEETTDGLAQYGEDITFCRRVRECGHDVYVDTTLECGHMKMAPLHSGLYALLKALPPHERAEYEKAHKRAMGISQ